MKKILRVNIGKMKCKSCAKLIRDDLNDLPSVSAKVDFETKKAVISFDNLAIKDTELLNLIKSKGYDVK